MAPSQKGGTTIIDDIFEILEVDPDGKKFDKVSRVMAHSQLYDLDMVLDINVDLYPVQAGEKVSVCMASTLNLDGSGMPVGDPGQQVYDTSVGKRPTLADQYEYVVFGKVFKYKDAAKDGKIKAEVYASFGGLLLQMSGDPKKLDEVDVDQSVYLLMRKV